MYCSDLLKRPPNSPNPNEHVRTPPDSESRSHVQIVRGTQITACDVSVRITRSIRSIQPTPGGTPKPQCRGTVLDKTVADVLARQDLLVRTRFDLCVDQRIPRYVRHDGLSVWIIGWQRATVDKVLPGIAYHQVRGVVGEIGAAWDADAAEPLLVRPRAVVTVDGEGEH